MKPSSGAAPAPAMLQTGLPVALANDGPASNDMQDMFEEMRTAAMLHKARGQPATLSARDVFRMATEHGARAGALDPGRLADVVLVDLDRPHLTLVDDVVALLVCSGRGGDGDTVFVDGRIVVAGGRLALAAAAEIVPQVRALGGERCRAMQAA